MRDNVSPAVERVVHASAIEQRLLAHPRIGTEHLLLGLLSDPGCESALLLSAAGVSVPAARHMVAEVVVTEPGSSPPDVTDLTPRAGRALDRAARFARRDRAPDVTDLHLLLGVLDVEGLACQVLRRLGVDLAALRRAATRDVAFEDGPDSPDASIAAAEAVAVPSESAIRAAQPICHLCRAALADALRVTTVEVADGDGGHVAMRLVHCGECGGALGVLG